MSLYFIYVLMIVMVCCSYLLESMQGYLEYYADLETFRKMNNVEVLVCRRLMYMYRNYKEKDEVLFYQGFTIEITIDGTKATYTIEGDGLSRDRVFVYDSETDTAEKYY